MKLSVIIPYYNSHNFLPSLSRTLSAQGVNDLEIIVVDDASDADSAQKLNDVAKVQGWKVIHHETNKGPGVARNTGITHASGDYIVFLDNDDAFDELACARLLDTACEHAPDMIAFNVTLYSGTNRIVYDMIPDRHEGWVEPDYAFAYIRSMTAGKCYRKDFITAHNLHFGKMRRHEDTAFTKAATSQAESLYYLPDINYQYHMREGSLVTDTSNASIESSFVALDYIRSVAGNRFPEALQYVYIVEVILSCAMKVRTLPIPRSKMLQLCQRFEQDEPGWFNNKYLKKATIRYRLIALLVHHRLLISLNMLMVLEGIVRKILRLG